MPQRNPLVVLKQLATLDLLSGGRIVTAVTAGWMEGEFAVLGADFERRGRILDDEPGRVNLSRRLSDPDLNRHRIRRATWTRLAVELLDECVEHALRHAYQRGA